MRHHVFLCSCLPAEPNEYRYQESVVKSHDVGVAPDYILDLAVRLLGRSYGIVTFTYKSSGKSLHPLIHDETVALIYAPISKSWNCSRREDLRADLIAKAVDQIISAPGIRLM